MPAGRSHGARPYTDVDRPSLRPHARTFPLPWPRCGFTADCRPSSSKSPSNSRTAGRREFETVALSGGCFQNRILFESVAAQLRHLGLVVLTHAQAPANDGGLSLGQAAIAAALLLETRKSSEERTEQCVSAFPVASSR